MLLLLTLTRWCSRRLPRWSRCSWDCVRRELGSRVIALVQMSLLSLSLHTQLKEIPKEWAWWSDPSCQQPVSCPSRLNAPESLLSIPCDWAQGVRTCLMKPDCRTYKDFLQFYNKKINDPIKTWAEKLNRHFWKEDIWVANRPVRKCFLSLVVQETCIKAAMRWHVTVTQMAVIKKAGRGAGEDTEKVETFPSWLEMQNDATALEKNLAIIW